MNRPVFPYSAYGENFSFRTWPAKVSLTHLMGAAPQVFSLTVAKILSAQVGNSNKSMTGGVNGVMTGR